MKLITDTLRDYRKGQLVEQASAELAEIVQAVISTGRSGKLVLTLSVKPNANDGDQVFLEAETKLTVPKAPLPTAIFYTDKDGGLHRADPRQREMFNEVNQRGGFTPDAAKQGTDE